MTYRPHRIHHGEWTHHRRAIKRKNEREASKQRRGGSGWIVAAMIMIIVAMLFSVARAQCSGSFLFYDHYSWYLLGNRQAPPCWTCDYTFAPAVTIKEPVQGRAALVYVSIADTNGARWYSIPSNQIYAPGVSMGLTVFSGKLWWGTLSPLSMGCSHSSWVHGTQCYVTTTVTNYGTSCQNPYRGDMVVFMHAKTWTPGRYGDTCVYDSVVRISHCPGPLVITQPESTPIAGGDTIAYQIGRGWASVNVQRAFRIIDMNGKELATGKGPQKISGLPAGLYALIMDRQDGKVDQVKFSIR